MVETNIFQLVEVSKSFATRTKGEELFKGLSKFIEEADSAVVIVDWNGVEAASPSFIDEFAGKACEALARGDFTKSVVFTGDNAQVTGLIDTILKRRGCQVEHALKPNNVQKAHLRVLGSEAGARVPA